MKRIEISTIYAYIYNNRCELAEEVRQMKQNLRYRNVDCIDCMELALLIERQKTFEMVSRDILTLLNLCDLDELNERCEK